MPKRVQHITQTTAQAGVFTGLPGEFTYDSDKKTIRTHDGINPGGAPLALEDLSSSQAATNAQDGKMTAALVTNLETAQSDVADLQGQTTGFLDKAISDGTTVLNAAENKNAIFRFSGTLTGNATITFDNTHRTIVIFNDTTGGFSLTCKTPAGVAAGVILDGQVGLISSIKDISGDITFNNMIIAGNCRLTAFDDVVGDDVQAGMTDLASKRLKLAGGILTGLLTTAALTIGGITDVQGAMSASGAGSIEADTLNGLTAAQIENNVVPDAGVTNMIFNLASAPTGWTQDVTLNDRIPRIVSGAGAVSGGSWTISGVTVDGVALTEGQLPAHFFLIANGGGANASLTVPPSTRDFLENSRPTGGFDGYVLGGANITPDRGKTNTVGNDETHLHGLTADGTWRPAYRDVITATRD